jgi:hypothetical protein
MATWNNDFAKLATAATRKDQDAKVSKKALVDALYASGILPEDFKAPAKGEDRAFYDGMRESIVAGFSKDTQALLAADVKALDEVKKGNRFYWQQQIGSTMKDWAKALQIRIDRANASESDGAGEKKSSWEATRRKELSKMIDSAQKLESTTIKDLTAFIKDLQSALARIPADA